MPESSSYLLTSSAPFNLEETELYELTQLAGVVMDPRVFKIILNLLKLNIQPKAIVEMLKRMSQASQSQTTHRSTRASTSTHRSKK